MEKVKLTPFERKKSDIFMALNKVVGTWATSEYATSHPELIPLHTLYSGVLIGLHIGMTDPHSARMVMKALGYTEVDPLTQNVAEEILHVIDREEE